MYRHFKGGLYEVLGLVTHSETLDQLVLYRHMGEIKGDDLLLSPDGYWVRPVEMFNDYKELENGKRVKRYEYIGDKDEAKNLGVSLNETEKTAELASLIDKVEDEKLVIENQLRRALADYANLQSNIDKRLDYSMTSLTGRVAKEIVAVADDFKIAIKASEQLILDEKSKAWMDGLVGLLKKIEDSLEKMGVKKIVVNIGDDFDASRHEAVSVVANGQKGKVAEIFQDGYILGDTVIRATRVVVGK